MSDLNALLERAEQAVSQVPLPDHSLERIFHVRDRRRRRQRISAGAVGIAVFGMAVWIVATHLSIDVPHERTVQPAWSADAPIWGGQEPEYYLPPKDALPSLPEEGEVIASLVHGFGDTGPPRFVFVYADGRVISWVGPRGGSVPDTINERRLDREGLRRVRSGTLPLVELFGRPGDDVPAEVWKDAVIKPFVPSRYELCFARDDSPVDSSVAIRFLPARARSVLAEASTPGRPGCLEVTTDQAWALVDVLGTISSVTLNDPHVTVQDQDGTEIDWDIAMILPDGARPASLRGLHPHL